MLRRVKYFASALSFAELSSSVPPQYEGQIWYPETRSLLEPLLTGGRLDFIAAAVQETVQAAHKERGWRRRPLVSPKMVLQEAVRSGYISEEEALKHWHWHRREKMRKESLERNISVDLRTEIFRRDGGLCQYCGSWGRTLDHLIPVSKGGLSVRLNLLVVCEPCNRKKYTKMPSDETVTVIRFFLKRKRTVEHGYPYMSELITQFFEQLATKSHLEQARIRGIIGIKRSKVFFPAKETWGRGQTLTATLVGMKLCRVNVPQVTLNRIDCQACLFF